MFQYFTIICATVQEELQKNGSPRAVIETNDERGFINVFIPIHKGCGERVVLNEQNGAKDGTKDDTKELTERQRSILELIRGNVTITTTEMAQKLSSSRRSIARDIEELQSSGFLTRQGGKKIGRWIILK